MKKASSLKSVEKSMASFMTTRLSSARCEGGPGNLPHPKVKNGGGGFGESLALLWQHFSWGQPILRGLLVDAPFDCFRVSPIESGGYFHHWGRLRGPGGQLTDP